MLLPHRQIRNMPLSSGTTRNRSIWEEKVPELDIVLRPRRCAGNKSVYLAQLLEKSPKTPATLTKLPNLHLWALYALLRSWISLTESYPQSLLSHHSQSGQSASDRNHTGDLTQARARAVRVHVHITSRVRCTMGVYQTSTWNSIEFCSFPL